MPVPAAAFVPGGDKPSSPLTSYSYREVGTNIDCKAQTGEEGRFALLISVEDTSVYSQDAATPGANQPVFRSFKSTNTLILRDGQTRQFTAATDRVSGEVVKVEVTLTVVK